MKKEIILFDARETIWNSLIKDLATFGFLLICIWASKDNTWWTFFTATLFLAFFISKAVLLVNERRHKFNGLDDLAEWVRAEQSAEQR